MAEETAGHKIHRSPNHPFFDLKEAVAKVKTVYDNEKRSATAPEVIVKHLGYSALNGPGGRTLSGLRQYGLLEEAAGRYKISDDGYALIHYSQDSEQWRTAVRRAALAPSLYRDLLGMYPDLTASDATFRVALLDKGFNPDVIDRVLGHFRSTMEFARLPDELTADPRAETKLETAPPVAASVSEHTPVSQSAMIGTKVYEFAFAGDGKAELKIVGVYTLEDLDDLEILLKTTLGGLKRSVKARSVQ
jgi:hypothetical protein